MTDYEKLIDAHKKLLNEWKSGKPVKPLYVYALDPNYLSDDVCKIIKDNIGKIAAWTAKDNSCVIASIALALILYQTRIFFEKGDGRNYWSCLDIGQNRDSRQSPFGWALGVDSGCDKNKAFIVKDYIGYIQADERLRELGIHDDQQLNENEDEEIEAYDYFVWFLFNCPFLSTEEAGVAAGRLENNKKVKTDPIIQYFLSNLNWAKLCDLHDNHPCQLQQMFSAVAEEFIEENVANDAQYPDSLDRLGSEKAYIHALLKYAPLEYLLSLKALITGGGKDSDEYRACVRIWPWLERLWGIAPSENDIGYVWHLHPGDNGTFYPCIQIKGLDRIALEQNDKEIFCNTNDPSLAGLKKESEINCEDDFNIVVPEAGKEVFRVTVHNPFKSGCAVFRDRKGHTLVNNGSQITKRVFVVYKGRQVTGKLVVRDAEFVVHPVADRVRLAGMPDLENWKIAVFEMPKVDAESVTWRFSGEFGDTELKLYQILKADWVSTLELRIEGEDCEVIVGDRAYYEKPQGVWEVSADGATDEGSYLQLNGEPNGQMLMVTERAERRSHRQKLFFLPPDWESRARKPELSRQIEYAEKGQCARVFACEDGKEVTILAPLQFPLWYWKDGNGELSQESLNIDEANGKDLWLESGNLFETAHLEISGDVTAEIDVSCWNGSLGIERDILEKIGADTLFQNVCISYRGEQLCHGRRVPADVCIAPNGKLYVPRNLQRGKSIKLRHERYYFGVFGGQHNKDGYEKEISLETLPWDENCTAELPCGELNWPSGYIFAEVDDCKREIAWKPQGIMPPLGERCADSESLSNDLLKICSMIIPAGALSHELAGMLSHNEWLEQTVEIDPNIFFAAIPWRVQTQIDYAHALKTRGNEIRVLSSGFIWKSPESDCRQCPKFVDTLVGYCHCPNDFIAVPCKGTRGIPLYRGSVESVISTIFSNSQADIKDVLKLDAAIHEDMLQVAKSSIERCLGEGHDDYCDNLSPSEITTLAFAANWLKCELDGEKFALNPSFKRILETPKALECAAHIYVILKTLTLL
ncbi:MAG: hypothetical protein MJ056_02750 [Akkermansia sp.]|nr:hypothetical protein [Akkermansia sp.]